LVLVDRLPIIRGHFLLGPHHVFRRNSLLMPLRRFNVCSLIAVLCAAGMAGCTPEVHNYIRFPNLFHPGWAPQQRAEALEHDPYPLDDMGPEVVGGRPREYQRPIPEVERARQGAPPPLGVPPSPVAPPFVTGPAVVVGPPVVTGAPVVTPPPVVTGPPVVTAPVPPAPTHAPPFQVQQRAPY
jgi:hypothetical protein